MNILQLLSVSPTSSQMQSHGGLGGQEGPDGFFRQALLQASGSQTSALQPQELQAHGTQSLSGHIQSGAGFSQASLLQGALSALDTLLPEALDLDSESLSDALAAMGIEASEQDLATLLAQLQSLSINQGINQSIKTPKDDSAETVAALDEIAARLTLISSFSDEDSSLANSPSISLEAIADHLNINQSEAAQLISVLNAAVIQNKGSQPLSPPSLASADTPVTALNSPQQPQIDNLFARISTNSSSLQISSEALMSALSAMESAPKSSVAGDTLPTGLALGTNQPPLAASQLNAGLAPAAAPTQATLTAPITSNVWPQQLGQQLVQISQRGGDQHVKMQLNPAELGPLSISLKFSEQGAQAHFLSASAQVRQVLEQSIPQLREALAEQGISLGDTSVGEQRDPNAQAFAQSGNQKGPGMGGGDSDAAIEETLGSALDGTPLTLDGRVDIYA